MITRRDFVNGFVAGGVLVTAACKNKGTAFSGFAIVASEAEHALSAVSLLRFRVMRQVGLEAAPSQVLALNKKKLALCLLPSRGTLVAVDNEGVAVRHKVRVADESLSMRLDEDGKRVWILNKAPNTLVAVDLEQFRPAARVRLASTPASFDVYGKRCAVSLPGRGEIAVVEDNRVARNVATGIAPEMICFRPDGRVVLAGDPGTRMFAVGDPATGQLMVKLPLPLKPRRHCYNSDGGQLFVTGDGMDAVSIVSPYQTEVEETILAGRAPAGMAVSTTDKFNYLFVTNSESGDVTVIDIESRRVLARIAVGQEPEDVIVTPDNQWALVLNRGSGDIAVIRIPAINAWGNLNVRARTAPLFTMIPVGLRPVSAAVCEV